jgi:hypothetical protein
VLSGSHRFGRVTAERIYELATERPEFVCKAQAGEVLVMRPLLLHCSGRFRTKRRRRCCTSSMPDLVYPALEWAE